MDMSLLGSAVALCLIFEGLMPFASPALLRKSAAYVLTLSDSMIRLGGLLVLGAGMLMLSVFGG